jgi:hypothetical protein
VRAAAKNLANVVNIGTNIEALTAYDAEIDFGKSDSIDSIAINVD